MNHINTTHQGSSVTIEFDKNVYSPGALTGLICDIMEIKTGDRVVDVGCGTGYIGITASLIGASEVICIDPEPEAIKWTNHNAKLNGVENLTAIQGQALDPVKHEPVDVIVTIPPQMPYMKNFNPWRYGGADGTEVIREIIKQAGIILQKKGSRLFLVHAALAFPAKVRDTFSEHGFIFDIVKTVEKKMDASELNSLAPGLTDFLMELARRGMAEIEERNGKYHYPVWFYRAVI